MLRQDQKIQLIEALHNDLTQLKGINSVKYFNENNQEFVEVITHEFAPAESI